MYDRFLPAFIAVAECGSLTSAADRLFLTPSAVMKQMNALEQRLGVKLLVRGSHGVQLTEAGKYVYAEAGKAISQGEAVMKRARDIEHGSEKIIRIGSSFPQSRAGPDRPVGHSPPRRREFQLQDNTVQRRARADFCPWSPRLGSEHGLHGRRVRLAPDAAARRLLPARQLFALRRRTQESPPGGQAAS